MNFNFSRGCYKVQENMHNTSQNLNIENKYIYVNEKSYLSSFPKLFDATIAHVKVYKILELKVGWPRLEGATTPEETPQLRTLEL